MSLADENDPRKEAPKPKPSRTEEAQRVIEDCLNGSVGDHPEAPTQDELMPQAGGRICSGPKLTYALS